MGDTDLYLSCAPSPEQLLGLEANPVDSPCLEASTFSAHLHGFALNESVWTRMATALRQDIFVLGNPENLECNGGIVASCDSWYLVTLLLTAIICSLSPLERVRVRGFFLILGFLIPVLSLRLMLYQDLDLDKFMVRWPKSRRRGYCPVTE